MGGRAVHARGGRREAYAPVRDLAEETISPGDPLALAGWYLGRCGLTELYAADLDAILDRRQSEGPNDSILARLSGLAPLWLDAGVSSSDRAGRAITLGASQVVVGLETLPDFATLVDICDHVGGHRVALSLDLRRGRPVVSPESNIPDASATLLARKAADAGVGAIIVIDLARVGTSSGLDIELIRRVRESISIQLLAGGGVRGPEDLRRLAEAGCDGALVASALHSGRVAPGFVLPEPMPEG